MMITIEIPEKEAPFVMKLLKSFKFLKIKNQNASTAFEDFRQQWNIISSRLPQSEPDMTEEEIASEIREVRRLRSQKVG